jgi:hypothetical protein
MNLHWQTLLALGIVSITLVIFTVRLLTPKKKSGCGKGCGCEKS